MAKLEDIIKLDWPDGDFPEDFEPLDAIILVKGVYQTDGDLSRPVWVHRWTMALARNNAERLGALTIATELTEREACAEYTSSDDED